MTGRVIDANLGLTGFWGSGFNGWGDENDANLLKLSTLVQGSVNTRTSTTPGSPTNGDVVLFKHDHATKPDYIAVRDAGAWTYYLPKEGWMVWVKDEDLFYRFDGSLWNQYAATVLGAAPYDAGTKTTGTFTLDPTNTVNQKYINGGAHTLAPPSVGLTGCYDMYVLITNNGSAGAITTSGFTKKSGDAFTTTNGHKFLCRISVFDSNTLLYVNALQ